MNDQKETIITLPKVMPDSEYHVELTWVEKLMMKLFPKEVKVEVVSTFHEKMVCTKCLHEVSKYPDKICYYCGAIEGDGIFKTFTQAVVRKLTTYTHYKTLFGVVITEQSYLTLINFIYPNRVRGIETTPKCDTIKDLHSDIAPLVFSSYKDLTEFPVNDISIEQKHDDVRYVYNVCANTLVPYFRTRTNRWLEYSLFQD